MFNIIYLLYKKSNTFHMRPAFLKFYPTNMKYLIQILKSGIYIQISETKYWYKLLND